jgi:phage-related minor tail protein
MATTTDVYKLVVETDEALSRVNDLAKGVAAAFVGMIGVVASFADEITDTADAFNATTAEVLSLSAALGAVGGKGDNAVKIFKGINDSIGELNDGNLKTLKNFQDLGISISQLGSMSESEIRGKVITQLGEMTNATERNALAFKMFGKAAIGVDWSKMASQMADNTKESEKYAAAIEDAGQAYDSMAKMLKQVKLAFAEAFNPVFKMLADTKVSTDAIATGFKVIAVTVTAVLVPLGLMRTAIMLATAAQAAFNTVTTMNPWIRGGMLVVAGVTAVATALGLTKDKQTEVNDETKKQGDETKTNAVKTDELNNKLKQQREEVMKIGIEYKRNTQALYEQLQLSASSMSMSKTQAQIAASNLAIEQKLRADIEAKKLEFNSKDSEYQKANMQAYLDTIYTITKQADEQKKITAEKIKQDELNKYNEQSLLAVGNAQADSLKDLIAIRGQYAAIAASSALRPYIEQNTKQQLEEINVLQKAINDSSELNVGQKQRALFILSQENKTTEDIAELERVKKKIGSETNSILEIQLKRIQDIGQEQRVLTQQTETFKFGWQQAFNNYYENATKASTMAGNAFNSVTRGMESAIDRFVDTGKFSFSDLASSIIRDLIKIEMKAQAMQLWKMMGGGGIGGGVGGSILSGIGGWLGGLLGFAEGGQPPMGKASIVGENGPELFVPRSAGTVIPNNQLGGGGQTVNNYYTTNVNNSVSALDAKSVAQLFAENKKTLFGVVESARREVPMRG